MADGGDQRDFGICCSPDDDLLVERHKVFERAAAARDDEQIRTRQKILKAVDGRCDLFSSAGTLDEYRPDKDMAGKTVFKPVQYIADYGTGR